MDDMEIEKQTKKSGSSLLGHLKAADQQMGKLQRLTQPYFLPLKDTNGWNFVWLLTSLVLVVGCGVMMLLALIFGVLGAIAPSAANFMNDGGKGDNNIIAIMIGVWHTPWGAAILCLFGIGACSFVSMRRHMRNRRWVPWLLLGLIVLMLLLINIINTAIGFISRGLTNHLVDKEEGAYYTFLYIYASFFVIALPIRTGQYYFTAKLGILWRQWLSTSLIEGYMGNRAYYALNPNDEETTKVDNPDQRITDDTRAFCRESLSFTIGIIDALLSFALNIMVLWTISKPLTAALFLWCTLCTGILMVASRKLVSINYSQLRYEADFRYGLVHIRNNAEAIAFYSGEKPEKQESHRRLGSVVDNYNRLIKWEVVISVLRRMYNYAGVFFPYMIMAPQYFSGDADYGSFVQANFAFNMVEGSISFIVQNIDELAKFWSGVSRLEGFQNSIAELNGDEGGNPINDSAEEIVVRCADLHTPGGEQLIVKDLSLSIGHGERILVVGPSGCGKTSVLRMISGLWQPTCGEVERPPVGVLLFIPQKPYMLLGSLREQLCYPNNPKNFSDQQLQEALREVSLEKLIGRYPDFAVKQDWPRLLSLGEQQRLAFARLLLSKPRFAVLDEATSALDVATERRLYQGLVQRGIAFVSVGHRPSLRDFHKTVLEVSGGGDWRLMPAASYNFEEHDSGSPARDVESLPL